MRKIEYTFTTLMRQIFFIAIFANALIQIAVVTEVLVFKIDKYYQSLNFTATYLIYALVVILVIALFFQHRLFYSEYTPEELTYKNILLRKSHSIRFEDIDTVVCDTFNAYFYKKENPKREKSDADFKLPFFRGGKIEILDFDKLLKFMAGKGINIIKTYKIMPGYSKKMWITSLVYGLFTAVVVANCATPLYTVIILYTRFH